MEPNQHYHFENMSEEIWKDIVGYEGTHVVSNFGRLKRVDRGREVLVKVSNHCSGYTKVTFSGKTILTHRLLASTFIPNPENKPCVNHINGIKHDNRLENLEWITHSENQKHAYKINLRSKIRKKCKRKCPVNQLNENGEIICEYESISEASRQTGCSHVRISYCIAGKIKKIKGLYFKYKD